MAVVVAEAPRGWSRSGRPSRRLRGGGGGRAARRRARPGGTPGEGTARPGGGGGGRGRDEGGGGCEVGERGGGGVEVDVARRAVRRAEEHHPGGEPATAFFRFVGWGWERLVPLLKVGRRGVTVFEGLEITSRWDGGDVRRCATWAFPSFCPTTWAVDDRPFGLGSLGGGVLLDVVLETSFLRA